MAAPVFVIMAGGRGERLWPLVRESRPKVCVAPDGTTSLLEAALQRLAPLCSRGSRGSRVLIVTTAEQTGAIRGVLPSRWRRHVLVEPEGKNTAACLALAAASLQAEPDRVMVALPADHWVSSPASWRRSLRAAIALARQTDELVMLGIRPARAHSGLGYLCVGPRLGTRQGCRVFGLRRFVEKPSPRLARRLLRRGQVFWNAGIFVGKAGVFLHAFRRWLPVHAARLIPQGPRRTSGQRGRPSAQALARAYRGLRPVSFDHGVMAHQRTGLVVEGRFGWEDLGSWDSWIRIGRAAHPAVALNSRNVHVVSQEDHLVAAVGVRNAVVIQTPDATLIAAPDQTQATRHVVARLRRNRRLARYV
ncbi:MAG: mannose-1-phosphate guanylyltransferase [Candidatus Omnitrophica bacterium]|nr:mannose-1-phosphate guanylyltransferase [Candidatus Omnitrophota bacterium]